MTGAPIAWARAVYSPLGSATNAVRPNSACRYSRVLTSADFPDPTAPVTRRLGLVSAPAAYSSNGSKQNDPPNRSRPM